MIISRFSFFTHFSECYFKINMYFCKVDMAKRQKTSRNALLDWQIYYRR